MTIKKRKLMIILAVVASLLIALVFWIVWETQHYNSIHIRYQAIDYPKHLTDIVLPTFPIYTTQK